MFIEVEFLRLGARGERVASTGYLRRRAGMREIAVLASGPGRGVKAEVVAGIAGSMAISYALADDDLLRGAGTIIRTFDNGDDRGGVAFTIMELHHAREARIVEYAHPGCIRLHGSQPVGLEREEAQGAVPGVFTSEFTVRHEDRLVLVNGGVTEAGRGTRRLPGGWGVEGVAKYCSELIAAKPSISAREMSYRVVSRAELNDLFAPKNELACVTVYFRHPRRIMVCSGPPFKESKDVILADMVDKYRGTKLICGGTTARILSRELKRDIVVDLKRDPAGLPPTSKMDGVDLITEGVLTLNKVKRLLEVHNGGEIAQRGTDGVVAKMLLGHDIVEFVVGTRINPIHQDPTLPVELELRRNLIKDLARLLETKYMKEVKIQYI